MNLIEEEIRTLLRSKASRAPVKGEPPPVVLRRTRMMRSVNGVTAVAGVAAVIVGIVLGAQSLGARRTIAPTAPVPWMPAPPASNFDPPQPVDATVPYCRVEDLTFTIHQPGAALIFEPKTPQTRCLLGVRDGLIVRLVDPSGAKPSVDAHINGSAQSVIVEGAPRQTLLSITRVNECGKPDLPTVVNVILPRAGGVLVAELQVSGYSCSEGGSFFNVDAVGTQDPSGPLANDSSGLAATMTLPAAVGPGQTLEFRVILENPSDEPIALEPCPNHFIELADGPVDDPDPVFYRLNCEGAGGFVPANEKIVFEMVYEVPDDLTPGTWTLIWGLDSAYGHAPLLRLSRDISVA